MLPLSEPASKQNRRDRHPTGGHRRTVTHSEAAKIGGVTLQVIRDWVLRCNAHGPDGLINGKAPGQPGMDAPASNLARAGEGPLEFVPVGVFGRAADEGPALVTGPPAGSSAASACMPAPNTTMQARPGLIEIDLTDGTRLRVDAFVNERALRRVLAVLKATA